MRRLAVPLAAGALLLPAPATAAVASGLTLNPSSGPPDQQFTASFTFVAGFAPCRTYTVDFTWDTVSLGSAAAQGRRTCTAAVVARPPSGDSTPGPHQVRAATSPTGFSGAAAFTIVGAAPSPTPMPTPTPGHAPTPTATPLSTPTPAAAPSSTTTTVPCTAAAVPAAAPATPTHVGDLEIQGITATIAVIRAGPPQMLPPLLGSQRLIAVDLSKPEDDVSPLLQDALTENTVYPCVYLNLGQGSGYAYARYAFSKATIIGLQSSLNSSFQLEETLTLAYRTVAWNWQGFDIHGKLVSRSGSGNYGSNGLAAAAKPPSGAPGWAWLLLGLAGLGGLAFGLRRWRSFPGR